MFCKFCGKTIYDDSPCQFCNDGKNKIVKPKPKLSDKIQHFKLKKLKKQMACPSCFEKKRGKLRISKDGLWWICDTCNYKILDELFADEYVFWFCDNCGTFLNNQTNFNRFDEVFICKKCGYKNDITESNIVGQCRDCGVLIPENPDATLCKACHIKRLEAAQQICLSISNIAAQTSNICHTVEHMCDTIGTKSAETHYFPEINESEETKSMNINYSDSWFDTASYSELESEREKVRQSYANASSLGLSDDEFDELYNLLNKFDNEIGKRDWNGKDPRGPVAREHGWYLSNDD